MQLEQSLGPRKGERHPRCWQGMLLPFLKIGVPILDSPEEEIEYLGLYILDLSMSHLPAQEKSTTLSRAPRLDQRVSLIDISFGSTYPKECRALQGSDLSS